MKYDFSNITLGMFKALVRTIAAERPEFVYRKRGAANGCFNHLTTDGDGVESRCLIGEALYRLGVEENDLALLSDCRYRDPARSEYPNSASTADVVMSYLGFQDNIRDWAQAVQTSQDTGTPWGKAAEVKTIFG